MENTGEGKSQAAPLPSPPAPFTPPALLLLAFWALLGAAAGITITQKVWRFLDWSVGEVSIAVPVGGVAGAAVGVLLGLVRDPRWQVLLVAVFAGSASGAVAGRVPWGETGEVAGQVLGGLVGAIGWSSWLFFGRKERSPAAAQPYAHKENGHPD